MKPLAIIPTYVTNGGDIEVLNDCLKSLRERTPDDRLDIMVVDDGSPDIDLRAVVYTTASKWDAMIYQKPENEGFSKTVNVGLRKALDEDRDAILVNADIEIINEGWLDHLEAQQGIIREGPAAVVGALLCFPNGLIQHGGVYFSLLTREFNHLWKYAPMNLPAARVPASCPVTGALQFIRHETLTTVGLYDEGFKMGYEDVDYCLRVFKESPYDCVYQPKVRAWHYESIFRGRRSDKLDQWHTESYFYLMEKWQHQSFAGLVPFR